MLACNILGFQPFQTQLFHFTSETPPRRSALSWQRSLWRSDLMRLNIWRSEKELEKCSNPGWWTIKGGYTKQQKLVILCPSMTIIKRIWLVDFFGTSHRKSNPSLPYYSHKEPTSLPIEMASKCWTHPVLDGLDPEVGWYSHVLLAHPLFMTGWTTIWSHQLVMFTTVVAISPCLMVICIHI